MFTCPPRVNHSTDSDPLGGTPLPGRKGFLRRFAITALLAVWSSAPAAQQPPFVEHVEVARLLIDARAFDDRGRPILGLRPSDFAVKIDGKAARVESAERVGPFPHSGSSSRRTSSHVASSE